MKNSSNKSKMNGEASERFTAASIALIKESKFLNN